MSNFLGEITESFTLQLTHGELWSRGNEWWSDWGT